MRTERDDTTIGLFLCESHDGAVVEFSFKDVQKPIGVSTYPVTREFPKRLEQEVPSVPDLKGVVERDFSLPLEVVTSLYRSWRVSGELHSTGSGGDNCVA